MRPGQVILILLLLAASTFGITQLLGDRRGAPAEVIAPVLDIPVRVQRGPEADQPQRPSTNRESRERPAPESAARFEVRALAEDGQLLPGARIVLSRDGQEVGVGTGSAIWTDVAPGPYVLEVDEEGLQGFRREVNVAPGASKRVLAKLLEEVPLQGRLTDVFGNKVAGSHVFLLRTGEVHPNSGLAITGMIYDVTDRDGRFDLEAPENGRFRLSVGKPGSALMTTESFEVQLGGPSRLQVVAGGKTLLRIVVEDPPYGMTSGEAIFRVAVLRMERGRERQSRPGKRARANDDAASVVPDSEATGWREIARERIGTDGRTEFEDLPPGVDLRLAFIRKQDRHESVTPFVLMSGRRTVARFGLPLRRDEVEREAEPTGRFYPSISFGSGQAVLKPGVTLHREARR